MATNGVQADKVPDTITVKYQFIDGAHFFTSDDPIAVGLCAASTDLKAAFDDVSEQITQLAKDNHGVTLVCKPAVTFEEWRDSLLESLDREIARRRARASEIDRSAIGASPANTTIEWRKAA